MSRHVMETDLALYAAGDLPFWRSVAVRVHVRRCDDCSGLVEAMRADREELRRSADDMPGEISKNFDWEQLSSEMTANIRVGLAAGECVTPRERKVPAISWRPAAIAAGLVVLMVGAWWLNIPRTDTETIGRALRDMATGGRVTAQQEERGLVVGASSSGGVELRENGGRLGIERTGLQPVMHSVSTQFSASARYVDDSGQVTITAVYDQ